MSRCLPMLSMVLPKTELFISLKKSFLKSFSAFFHQTAFISIYDFNQVFFVKLNDFVDFFQKLIHYLILALYLLFVWCILLILFCKLATSFLTLLTFLILGKNSKLIQNFVKTVNYYENFINFHVKIHVNFQDTEHQLQESILHYLFHCNFLWNLY